MNETRSLPVAEISRWIPRITDRSVSSICKEISNEGEIRGEKRKFVASWIEHDHLNTLVLISNKENVVS